MNVKYKSSLCPTPSLEFIASMLRCASQINRARIARNLVAVLTVIVIGMIALPMTAYAQYVDDQTIVSEDVRTDQFFGKDVSEVDTIDGTPVLVVGAPWPSDAGRVYLLNSDDRSVRATLTSPNPTLGGRFGRTVESVGDVTGDGISDVVVGAPQEDSNSSVNNAGAAYIFDGEIGVFVRELQTGSDNQENGRRFGEAVAGIGDVNGDGTPDVIVGAPGQDIGGNDRAGKAYLFSGADGSVLDVITGAEEDTGLFGASVAKVGNLVGDSTPDVAIGAYREDGASTTESGRVYLIDGNTLDQTVITSPNAQSGGFFGRSLASIGKESDRDLIVGASNESVSGSNGAGRAYVINGADPAGPAVAITSDFVEPGGEFGRSVAGIKDVNRDSIRDVLVGAPGETREGADDAGRAYVADGATGAILDTLTSSRVEDGRFGEAVGGTSNLVIGAPEEDVSSTLKAGRLHTFRIPNIAFVDGREGEAYDPSEASAGEMNVPVGRFKLTTDDARSVLGSVTVSNQGSSVSGVNSLELWTSANDVFDASDDEELASTAYSGTATFSGLDFSLSTGGTYIFVVVDLGSSPSGEYDPAIASDADIEITDGQVASVNGVDATTFSVTNGQGFLSLGPTAPLPVELAAFDADVTDDRSVRLQWQTTSETGNSGFRVQRSVSGTSWSTLGRVEGAGTTDEPQSYRFTDSSVPYASDSLQYRLAQVDVDGTMNVSDPVTVRFGNPDGLELLGSFPNPARSQATVRFAIPEQMTGDVQLELYDLLGRQVKTIPAAEASGRVEQTLDVSDLPSGTYLLRLSAGGQTQTQQVTIVR
jgi:hypothetical protein